jgi:CheY-like chemotaxis protein
VGVDNYIQAMAEYCFQVYQEMTGKKAISVNINQVKPPFTDIQFKIAIVIAYENKKDNFEGRFILGFNDTSMAIRLADAIAKHAGMPEIDQMDEMATDILFEFMNTVAGKVITEWDRYGIRADFFPPEFVSDLNFNDLNGGELLLYSVTLSLPNKTQITILTSLEETEKNPLKDKKVLVVDDSKMIRFLLASEFKKHGCQVSQAENGLDGFIQAQSYQPDLIIMDLIMPKMGGLEAIAKIREINDSIPIIVLTSTSKKEEVMIAVKHKVKGYIKKPIQMDNLLKLAKSCFL